jgi:hypothetical protein
VAVRGNNRIDLVFRGPGNQLMYRRYRPGGTTASNIVTGGCCSGAPSLEIYGATPMVAFSRRTSGGSPGRLRVATRAGGAWSLRTIDTAPTRNPTLEAVDPLAPLIAYVRPGSGTWWARADTPGSGDLIVPGYSNPPDIARNGVRQFAVAGNGSNVRIVNLLPHPVVTKTLASGFNPEIEMHNGKARVIFNRAGGTTNDGIFFTRRR